MARIFAYIFVAIMVPLVLHAEDRDPFKPYLFEAPASSVDDAVADVNDTHSTVRPLNEEPLATYRLIGLVVSPAQSLAVVQSSQRREYFLSVGDVLGKEGGVVDSITVDGVGIDLGDEVVNLKVTNKFEMQNESR